jgi:S1-C subfamily serine protease
MSESDQTWNAGDGEPTADGEPTVETPASHAAWPQYTWPPTADDAPTAPSAAASAPTPDPDPTWVSWPPTQPEAAYGSAPQAPPTQPNPGPYGAPYAGAYGAGPYSSAPYGTAPGAPGAPTWGPPPGWGAAPPAGWTPAPDAGPPAPYRARRGLAVVAALALVLASAGVGAGVAIAVHGNSKSQNFSSAGSNSPSDNSGNGSGVGGSGFGNNFGGGTVPSGSGSLDQSAIAAKVDPALVDINTTLAQGRAAGTGMLISSDGEILTNNHVIADATSIHVVVNGGTGKTYAAKVVGYDVTEDVALIKISDKVSGLPTVTFGDPSKVNVGDPVVAIGNAGGRGGSPSVSQGQVTALDQQVTAGDAGGAQETLEGMIQINAPIQPGDSGGALVNANAQIIGMNTAAAGGGQFNASSGSNIGFAIPVDHAVSIVSTIRSGSNATNTKVHIGDRALLGVSVEDIDGQSAPVSSGALVTGVQDGTGASSAGIQAGDVIVSINGKAITDSNTLRLALDPFHPGDSANVGWVNSTGSQKTASIKLVVGPPL